MSPLTTALIPMDMYTNWARSRAGGALRTITSVYFIGTSADQSKVEFAMRADHSHDTGYYFSDKRSDGRLLPSIFQLRATVSCES